MLHGTHHFWCLLQWVLDAMALLDHSSGELENPSRLWLDDDPAFAFEAFALLAGRIFVAPELGRFAPPHGIARWRASWLSDYFLSCLIAGGREKNKFRAALGRGFRVAMLRRGLGRKLGTLAWFFRPTASDLEHFNGDRLPLFLLYVARPFLLLARIARDLRSGGDGERV